MQKNTKNASILIWSIFLSMIISISFISISLKINKNLKNNTKIINQYNVETQIKNLINSGSINLNFNNQYLYNGDKVIFEPSNNITFGLKEKEIHLAKINENSNLNIKILNGGPIKYINNGIIGIVNSNKSITVETGNLSIINLGGYAKVKLTSSTTNNYLSKYRNYKIIKTIGNKKIIRTTGKVKNF